MNKSSETWARADNENLEYLIDKALYWDANQVYEYIGGDKQDQWTLQFFINYKVFGMNVQEALDAPTVHSGHFPASFWPHTVRPQVRTYLSGFTGLGKYLILVGFL